MVSCNMFMYSTSMASPLLDFRLWDKVRYNGKECFVSGRRSAGTLMLKRLDGTAITNSVNYKKVTLLEMASKYPIERM